MALALALALALNRWLVAQSGRDNRLLTGAGMNAVRELNQVPPLGEYWTVSLV